VPLKDFRFLFRDVFYDRVASEGDPRYGEVEKYPGEKEQHPSPNHEKNDRGDYTIQDARVDILAIKCNVKNVPEGDFNYQ
jgi:hypothetical protein